MPEITKTRVQLIERAATELAAPASGQSLSDEDSDTIDNLVDPLIRALSLDGVVNIQDTDAIESEYFIYLAPACQRSGAVVRPADEPAGQDGQRTRAAPTERDPSDP